MEHTLGPWEVRPMTSTYQIPIHADGVWIGSVDAGRTGFAKEAEANARLIAAAPDLLNLLRRIERHLDGGGTIQPENGVHVAIIAAIEKAKEKE